MGLRYTYNDIKAAGKWGTHLIYEMLGDLNADESVTGLDVTTIVGDVTITKNDQTYTSAIGSTKVVTGMIAANAVTSAKIGANAVNNAAMGSNAVLTPNVKYSTRTLTVAIGASTATATNAADINGVPLAAYFSSASADATATEIRSLRFVPASGALTVTVNANATASTVIVVNILQAS
jgi:hypothetical protein